MKSKLRIAGMFAFVVLYPSFGSANDKEGCQYRDTTGRTVIARSFNEIPTQFRSTAVCAKPGQQSSSALAKPQDIALQGTQRVEDMNTSIGRIHLRWERQSEKLFGRTPVRAMSDAANTLAKALKNSAFPSRLQNLSLDWQVVFLGENIPSGQVPTNLITNCHPGWMTPPANIYVVSSRVAGGCGQRTSSTSVADTTLTEVLLHEMGHAVEFYLLEGRGIDGDRMRAEGFATFFEIFSSRYSSILSSGTVEREQLKLAKESLEDSPGYFTFSGTGNDYARAAMYFYSLEKQQGLRTVIKVYDLIKEKSLSFFPALKEASGWDEKRREKELENIVGIKH